MPPTAIEIKARLDKAVDEEGNVLDMEAVLEIVASLEKIVMTKESLEITRIGKTINLIRKKTSNKDLRNRAKKLVKKWQTFLSNHFQITLKPENKNGVVKRKDADQSNGNKTETCQADPEVKLAPKRKRNSPDNCSIKPVEYTSVKPGPSPRAVSSPKSNASPKLGLSPKPSIPPRLGVSPKHPVSPKHGASPGRIASPARVASPGRIASPKVRSKLDHPKVKQSGLIVSELGNDGQQTLLNNSTCASEELASDLNCSDFLNNTHENNNEQYISKHHNRPINHIDKLSNDYSNNMSRQTDTSLTNSTDTRTQEDRIVLSDYISNGTTKYSSPTTTAETTNNNNTQEENILTDNGVIPTEFAPIEPEDLEVVRKELPENLIAPETEADGVNGVYDPKNKWCPWDNNVEGMRDNGMLLLPYVILD